MKHIFNVVFIITLMCSCSGGEKDDPATDDCPAERKGDDRTGIVSGHGDSGKGSL